MARQSFDHISTIPLFAECSKKELRDVAKLMTEVHVRKGRELTTQGEPGREFMIILDGTADVKRDGMTIAHLGPGHFLGEMAVLTGEPRNATVTATTDMTLEALNRREFMSLLDESPQLAKKILIGALRRLSQNENPQTN